MAETPCVTQESNGLTKQQIKNKKKREAAKLKKKQLQTSTVQQTEGSIENKTNVDEEVVEDNYEEELAWCINQLELGLSNQKAAKDQESKARKLLSQFRSVKVAKNISDEDMEQATQTFHQIDENGLDDEEIEFLQSSMNPYEPKKRMLMRQTFGDYREQIKKEKQHLITVKPPVLVDLSKEEVSVKGKFIKKKTNDLPPIQTDEKCNHSFKFDFPNPT